MDAAEIPSDESNNSTETDPNGTIEDLTAENNGTESENTVLSKEELDLMDMKHDYKWLIEKSIWFYESQRSGNLTSDNRVPWRGDSLWFDKGMSHKL